MDRDDNHRYVEDCDAAVKRAEDAGATVQMLPEDMVLQQLLVDDFQIPDAGTVWGLRKGQAGAAGIPTHPSDDEPA